MSYSQYTNIDGDVDTITPWESPGHGLDYPDLGDDDGYLLKYTMIEYEIPTISGALGLTDSQYWEQVPSMQSKLSTHNTFTTSLEFYPSSLSVMINGSEVDSSYITLSGTVCFSVDTSVEDGYMWVSYIPNDPTESAGDHRNTIDGAKVSSTLIAPVIQIEDIVRCRKAINAVQIQSEYPPSNWIGGPNNSVKSQATNIIKRVTEIYGQHITEMQVALTDLASHIDGLTSSTVPSPSFTSVVDSDPYSVQYIEEIRYAINTLEEYLIAIL